MAYDKEAGEYHARRIEHEEQNGQLLKGSLGSRFHGFLRWIVMLPYFCVLWFFISVVGTLTPADKKNWKIWLSRHYLKALFSIKGIDIYTIGDFTFRFDKPTVIFAVRDHVSSALCIHSLFKGTLIVPIGKRPLPAFTSGLKHCSYPDQDLPSALPTIKELVNKGYPTVVFVNRDFALSSTHHTLGLYSEINDFLLRDDVDSYFLSLSGADSYDVSSLYTPFLLSAKLRTPSELLDNAPVGSKAAAMKIAEFFQFRYVRMES